MPASPAQRAPTGTDTKPATLAGMSSSASRPVPRLREMFCGSEVSTPPGKPDAAPRLPMTDWSGRSAMTGVPGDRCGSAICAKPGSLRSGSAKRARPGPRSDFGRVK